MEIPPTSRAAVVTGFNEPLEVRELPIPEIEPGAVLVKIDAATVCGSDLHIWTGALSAGGFRPINLPVVPGQTAQGTPLPAPTALRGEPSRTYTPASNGG